VYLNGGGRDPELRFTVLNALDVEHGSPAGYGAANDFCAITPGLRDTLGPDAVRRLGARGLYEPTKAEVLTVIRWVDQMVLQMSVAAIAAREVMLLRADEVDRKVDLMATAQRASNTAKYLALKADGGVPGEIVHLCRDTWRDCAPKAGVSLGEPATPSTPDVHPEELDGAAPPPIRGARGGGSEPPG
jgi:hypothetical protein